MNSAIGKPHEPERGGHRGRAHAQRGERCRPADEKSAGRRRVSIRLRRRLFLTRNGLVRPMCHTPSLGAVLARYGLPIGVRRAHGMPRIRVSGQITKGRKRLVLCVFFADSDGWSTRLRAEFAHRLMKARKGLAAFAVMAAAPALGWCLAWNAGLFGARAMPRPLKAPPMREEAARRAEHLAFTEAYLAHEAREMRVANGETLGRPCCARGRARAADANAALASIAGVYDPRRLRPGQSISSVLFARTRRRRS